LLRHVYEPYEVKVGDKAFKVGPGELLDRASKKLPHRPEPLMMSVNLAQKAKDPRRMADSIERLLALGWPGMDEAIRLQARQVAEATARELREVDRSAEAEALLAGLAQSEARDVYIRLAWTGYADLDLQVEEPLGATANHDTPRTVFGGAILQSGIGGRHT